MFNFSANHLFLFSRTEYPTYAVFLLQDCVINENENTRLTTTKTPAGK